MKQKIVQDRGAWIGLYRKADNRFYWIDGTPLAGHYSAWAKGEPNNYQKTTENCVHTYTRPLARLGKWNDNICNFDEADKYLAPVLLCQRKQSI